MSDRAQMSEETLEDVNRLNEQLLTLIFDKGDPFTSRPAGPDCHIRLLSLTLKYEFARPDVAVKVTEMLSTMGVSLFGAALDSAPFVCEYRVKNLMQTLIQIACWSAKHNKTIHAKWVTAPGAPANTKTLGNYLFEQFVENQSN